MIKKYIITNLNELDKIFSSYDTKNISLVNYILEEQGFIMVIYNLVLDEFFLNCGGERMCICFKGQEILVEDKCDILIVLEKFTDNKKLTNNDRTDFSDEFKKQKNLLGRSKLGMAYWFTIVNFDENKYEKILDKYKFKNIIYPFRYDKKIVYKNRFGFIKFNKPGKIYKLGIGEQDWFWKGRSTLECHRELIKKSDKYLKGYDKYLKEPYATFFIRNSYKNTVNTNTNLNMIDNIINLFIRNNKKLIVFQDLIHYSLPKNNNIIEITMNEYLDINLLVKILSNTKIHFGTPSGTIDISILYCNYDLVLLTDTHKNLPWEKYVLELQNKYDKKLYYCLNNKDIEYIEEIINKKLI